MRAGVRLQLALKRAVDLGLAAALIVLLLPAMGAIATAVRWSSPGEIVFRQRRAGRDGRPFTMLKFRTMHAPLGPLTAGARDDAERVTRVGRFLRATGLDELPQLFNVLRGEMSFVGPRPDLPHHVERYSDAQRERLLMRPGITGWAQVNGRTRISWEKRIELDAEYIRNWSLLRDAVVVFRTVAVVLSGDAAPPGR